MRLTLLAAALVPAAALSLLVACSAGAPSGDAAKSTDDHSYQCDLDRDHLDGKTFVRLVKKDSGAGYDEDSYPPARATFYKEGDVTKVKYNVKSLSSVYTYTCQPDDKNGLVCMQDDPDLVEFCRALIANLGDDACSEAQLAAAVGIDVNDQVKKTVADVNAAYKKLKGDKLDEFKKGYNSPKMQLRGVLRVSPPKKAKTADDCHLNFRDRYMTYNDGKQKEYENIVGDSPFGETTQKYAFENCDPSKDLNLNVVALADAASWVKPGQSTVTFAPASAATFRYVGDKDVKPESGCTYTMDTFYDGEPVGTAVPVQTDDKGRLNWSFTKTVSGQPVKYQIGHIYRYKACGGAQPQRIDVGCAAFDVTDG